MQKLTVKTTALQPGDKFQFEAGNGIYVYLTSDENNFFFSPVRMVGNNPIKTYSLVHCTVNKIV